MRTKNKVFPRDEWIVKQLEPMIDRLGLPGYFKKDEHSLDIFFRQFLNNTNYLMRIPYQELEDEAWPVIEAKLKFYGRRE